jgi:sugar O-acyltransferase (sialic acid O-acetyltransferase NeuD family)
VRQLVIFGCGGHGREVADIVDAVNSASPTWELLGFADDKPGDEDIERLCRSGRQLLSASEFEELGAGTEFVVGIGSGAIRRSVDERLTQRQWIPTTLVHPSATLGSDVTLGQGAVLFAGAHITTNVKIGRHVHVGRNSSIGHDCELGDFVTLNPLVAVSGSVTLGDEVMMGTHSSILQNLSMGARSVAGAGSCVVRDVIEDVVVKGVPAR